MDPKVREPIPWLCFAGTGAVWLKALSLLKVVWAWAYRDLALITGQ